MIFLNRYQHLEKKIISSFLAERQWGTMVAQVQQARWVRRPSKGLAGGGSYQWGQAPWGRRPRVGLTAAAIGGAGGEYGWVEERVSASNGWGYTHGSQTLEAKWGKKLL